MFPIRFHQNGIVPCLLHFRGWSSRHLCRRPTKCPLSSQLGSRCSRNTYRFWTMEILFLYIDSFWRFLSVRYKSIRHCRFSSGWCGRLLLRHKTDLRNRDFWTVCFWCRRWIVLRYVFQYTVCCVQGCRLLPSGCYEQWSYDSHRPWSRWISSFSGRKSSTHLLRYRSRYYCLYLPLYYRRKDNSGNRSGCC